MPTNPHDAIKELRRLAQATTATQRAYEAQLDLCFELGCRTFDIANATGMQAPAVSNRRRRWRERRLMVGAIE